MKCFGTEEETIQDEILRRPPAWSLAAAMSRNLLDSQQVESKDVTGQLNGCSLCVLDLYSSNPVQCLQADGSKTLGLGFSMRKLVSISLHIKPLMTLLIISLEIACTLILPNSNKEIRSCIAQLVYAKNMYVQSSSVTIVVKMNFLCSGKDGGMHLPESLVRLWDCLFPREVGANSGRTFYAFCQRKHFYIS